MDIDARIQKIKKELNDDSNEKIKIKPDDPYIDPSLARYYNNNGGITKKKYDELVEGVKERDKKKKEDDKIADEFISQVKNQSEDSKNNKLMDKLDKITTKYSQKSVNPQLESYDESKLESDLDKIYIEYKKTEYMHSMFEYINIDVFSQCHEGDMKKVEKCLLELKEHIQNKDNPTKYENAVLFTIECIFKLYESENADYINKLYKYWYDNIIKYSQTSQSGQGKKKKKRSKTKKKKGGKTKKKSSKTKKKRSKTKK